jgi:hypothetical protein
VSDEILLFPLRTVLLPHARIALQVFEPRYMDMVKACLQADAGFGIIALQASSEVYQPGRWRVPQPADIGCYGAIVDWNALPHGRLGLVVEGQKKFRLLHNWEGSDRLLHGGVEWLDAECDQSLPAHMSGLPDLLASLSAHPTIQQLNMQVPADSALLTANQLAQLLPVSMEQKLQLLCLESPMARLALIAQFLDELES